MAIKTLDTLVLALPVALVSCAPAIVANIPKEPATIVSQYQQTIEQQNRNYSRELADLVDLNASRLPNEFTQTPYGELRFKREIYSDERAATYFGLGKFLSGGGEIFENPYGFTYDTLFISSQEPGELVVEIDIRRQSNRD